MNIKKSYKKRTKKLSLSFSKVINYLSFKHKSKNYSFNNNCSDIVKISFVLPSRIKGNETFGLNNLITSIIDNAYNSKSIEVIVVIDNDDDLYQYQIIKDKFNQYLTIKVIVSSVRYSYIDFHKYFAIGIDNASPSSKMLNMSSDDMIIRQKHFDKTLLDIDKKYPDNFYIIHSQEVSKNKLFGKNHDKKIEIDARYNMFFYLFATQGVAYSFFPFVSKSIFDVGKDLESHSLIKNKNWRYIANCNYDWYTGMISNLMMQSGLQNRVFFSNMISRNMKTVADYHVKKDEFGFIENQYLFQIFFEKSTIEHLELIVSEIIKRSANNLTCKQTIGLSK